MRPGGSQELKISGSDTTASAVSASSPSPIDSGSRVGLAPIVPDSYTSPSDGACGAGARLGAVLGAPIPTKQTCPSCSALAAATAIISAGVQPCSPERSGAVAVM